MWALLPLKNFAQAKQRLSAVLTPLERRGLFLAMVKDVLSVLQAHPDIEQTLIVSDESVAESLAAEFGAEQISEMGLGARGLNQAVQAGVEELARRGVDEVMVVHGDLPLMSTEEITQLVETHRRSKHPTLTIAPDRARTGSNCLLCSPASKLEFRYGPNSLSAHAINAGHLGLAFQLVCLPGVGCDIDEAEDLQQLIQAANPVTAPHSYYFILAFLLTNPMFNSGHLPVTDRELQRSGAKQ